MTELHLKDGATWRTPSELHLKDGATWRLASEVWLKDGTTWRRAYVSEIPPVLTASVATSGTLNSSDTTYPDFAIDGSDIGAGPTTVTINIFSDIPVTWTKVKNSGTNVTFSTETTTQLSGILSAFNAIDAANYTITATSIADSSETGTDAQWDVDDA